MLGYLSIKYRYSAVNSFGHQSIKISEKSDITGCNSRYPSPFATKRELNLHQYVNHHIKALAV